MSIGIGRIFFQGRGPTMMKFNFTNSKLREKHFYWNVNRKISNFTFQGPRPAPAPPPETHGHGALYCIKSVYWVYKRLSFWVLYQNNFNRTEMMKLMLLQSFFIDNQYVICHSCFCVSHFCGCIFVDWSVVHKKTKKQEKTTVQNCFTKDWCSWYNHLAETN